MPRIAKIKPTIETILAERAEKMKERTSNSMEVLESLFSEKNKQLLRRTRDMIDSTWQEIKAGKLSQEQPEFIKNKTAEKITLKPVYSGYKSEILLKIEKDGTVEQIFIPKETANEIRYEKIKKTEYGSATIKSYNSRLGQNNDMNIYVNGLLNKYLPEFIKEGKAQKHLL